MVRGTWIAGARVVPLIVDGWSWADVLRSHPELSEVDVRACLIYALEEENASPSIPEQNTPNQRPKEAGQGSAPLPFWIRWRCAISAGSIAAPVAILQADRVEVAVDRLVMAEGNRFTLKHGFRLFEGLLNRRLCSRARPSDVLRGMRRFHLQRAVVRVAAELLEISD